MRRILAFAVLALLVLHPEVAFAAMGVVQDAPSLSPLAGAALAAALVLSGYIAKIAYDGIKTILPFYDNLPAVIHQVAAPFLSLAFGYVSTATGAELLSDVHSISANWLGAIFTMLLSAGFKRLEKAQHPGDATLKVERSRTGVA